MDTGLTPLWISIRTSLLATIITFFLGIGTAYLVANYKGKGRGIKEKTKKKMPEAIG